MPTFGPTFGDELRTAGLAGLPISWTEGGLVAGRQHLTPEENAALDAVIAAHDPAARGAYVLLKSTIINRLSDAELAAAEAARDAAPLRHRVLWRDIIQLELPDARLEGFFSQLFGEARAAEILAPE